jgi:membrane-associated phospholipid phosphatase
MALATVATANHYLLDVAGGVVFALVGLWVALIIERHRAPAAAAGPPSTAGPPAAAERIPAPRQEPPLAERVGCGRPDEPSPR